MMPLLFPTRVSITAESLGDRFARLESDAGEAHRFRFAITLPRRWQRRAFGTDTSHGAGMLACFGPNDDVPSAVCVNVIESDREVNPADWLEITYAAVGAQILQRRDAFGPQGKVSDMLVRCVEDNVPTIRRGILVKDGSRMFHVEARAAESAYAEFAEDLFVCLISFELLNPTGELTSEPMIEEHHDGAVPFTFRCPCSWKTLQVADNGHGRILELTSQQDGRVVGRMIVEVRARSSGCDLQTLAAGHADRLRAAGIHFNGAPLVPIKPPERFQTAAVFAPAAECAGHTFDSPVLLFEHARGLVLLALLGPTRDESPEWWAINKRAFEIVRDSLRIDAAAAA
jgi:hypothetical protein